MFYESKGSLYNYLWRGLGACKTSGYVVFETPIFCTKKIKADDIILFITRTPEITLNVGTESKL